MNWYKGNISEAVALSKTKNAIFVVYVEGKDEATIKLTGFINDSRIRDRLESDDFVAIKIEGESESYMQFASIFQMVPVPSIFFIGKTGTPLDIATGVLNTVEELEGKIVKVLVLAGKTSATSSVAMSDFIQEESKASTSTKAATDKDDVKQIDVKEKPETTDEIECKDGVCFKKSKESTLQNVEIEEQPKTSQANHDEEEKLAETRKYLEQKRRERIEEEKRLEKERELRRRKEGKEMQNLRAWQKNQELKELQDNLKREKLEELAARERIKAQIAADKAERAHKFSVDSHVRNESEKANDSNTNIPSVPATDESRLQFRLANGSSNNKNFNCSTTLTEIRNYVAQELLPGTGIKDFSLATTYPKRELTSEHDSKTLTELELFPSAVILIIGKEATGPSAIISRNGGLINMMSLMVMAILNPIFSIFSSAKNWLTGKRNPGGKAETGAQKRANEDQNQQNDLNKRRNLDRFLTSGTGNTTGTSNPDKTVSSPGPSDGAYRRYAGASNIHRLSDNRKDSDDENATWNGNSTQQQ